VDFEPRHEKKVFSIRAFSPPQPLSSGVNQSAPLQGGIQNGSLLNPSLRLTPQFRGNVNSNGGYGQSLVPLPDPFGPVQFKGNVRSGPPLPAAIQTSGPEVEMLSGSNRKGGIFGIIPPIYSYNRTPARGVVNYVPGADFSSVSRESASTSFYSNSAPSHYRTIGRGITVLSSELTVSALPAVPAAAVPGIFSWLSSVQMIAPGMNTYATMRTNLPNSEEHYITRHGITTAPGYEVAITPPGLSKETLGGTWSANQPNPAALMAVPGSLQSQRIFTRIEPVQDLARAGLLTQLQAKRSCGSWPDWYRVVARAIYSSWQNADVCPGTAKLEVTVKPNHDISGRVVDFKPAEGVARNIARETEFRETSVKIVNQIGYFEIPDFPDPPSTQVVFDIDLKRTVNGPTGISIEGMSSK